MKFDRVKAFAARCRRLAAARGCKDCGKVLPHGLFLRGNPSLSDMVREGRCPRELKEAMRSRGWYCKKCIQRQTRIGTAAASLRDQFPTQDEYYEFLFWRKNGPAKFEATYGKPYTGLTLGVVHGTAAAASCP